MAITAGQIAQAVGIAQSYGATRIILFGSGALSPETARDMDLAVEGIGGWDLYCLAGHLMAAIPVPVDLVALENARDSVLGEEIRCYGKVLYEQAGDLSHVA